MIEAPKKKETKQDRSYEIFKTLKTHFYYTSKNNIVLTGLVA